MSDTDPAPFSAFASVEGESWWVCHTKPRCEKKFAALMNAERMPHYLPLITSVRRYGNRERSFTKPLFASYVFARVPDEKKARIYQQDLLARALPVTNEALFLAQLADVQRIVSSGFETSIHPLFKQGQPVRVVSGPLRGLEGVIDDPADPKGIIVTVDVLQQGLHVSIPIADLKILPR
ncbi:transcription termination/antitermination protein NusG [Actomonas aquatica]|uniref:Transcription termination/antitermination NusG family protein n=1 Tax=Actomonas aquatica TaxID=2866162 RepID=A0ABZ1CBD3_9BACT|nr:transcription termination/antitermination NusG family protein [Opitutus sp. WL0086]WRQ88991.1 transcription termination/antitermination NusG family protein [Opitutus sp. WL0086]